LSKSVDEEPSFLKNKNEYNIDQEMFDSRQEATHLLKKIIAPIKVKEFFR
jgi:hypothetical protein